MTFKEGFDIVENIKYRPGYKFSFLRELDRPFSTFVIRFKGHYSYDSLLDDNFSSINKTEFHRIIRFNISKFEQYLVDQDLVFNEPKESHLPEWF